MIKNRVKRLYGQGKPAFGVHIKIITTTMAEIAASVGFDYVRIDLYKSHVNPETFAGMMRTIQGYDATPWARCSLDEREIGMALDSGAQIISAKVSSPAEARAAVAAVRYPPKGVKESSRPQRYLAIPDPEYLRWAEEEVLLCLQLESTGAWQNYREIVKVEGVDIIEFGKHGISQALGVPNELSGYGKVVDPRVLEAEKAVVTAALDAGKQAKLMDSMTPWGLERLMRWVEKGVLVITLDSDMNALYQVYGDALKTVRGQ